MSRITHSPNSRTIQSCQVRRFTHQHPFVPSPGSHGHLIDVTPTGWHMGSTTITQVNQSYSQSIHAHYHSLLMGQSTQQLGLSLTFIHSWDMTGMWCSFTYSIWLIRVHVVIGIMAALLVVSVQMSLRLNVMSWVVVSLIEVRVPSLPGKCFELPVFLLPFSPLSYHLPLEIRVKNRGEHLIHEEMETLVV